MNPKVVAVQPMPDYRLDVEVANGERRLFDLVPYLDKGVFRKLKDARRFGQTRVIAGSVE